VRDGLRGLCVGGFFSLNGLLGLSSLIDFACFDEFLRLMGDLGIIRHRLNELRSLSWLRGSLNGFRSFDRLGSFDALRNFG
jgi:hypothetical protein